MKPAALALLASAIALASDPTFELRGQVTGSFSNRRVHVEIFGVETPFTATAKIERGGSFRVQGLPPGNYTVALVRRGLGEIRRTVVVSPALAGGQDVVRMEIAYSAGEAANMDSGSVSVAELSVSRQARRLYEKGQDLRARGDAVGAMSLFQEAAGVAPQFASAWNAMGVLAFLSGDAAAAERHYRQGIAGDPEAIEPLVNLGALLLRAGRGTEAIAYNERAASLRPHDSLALVQYGINLFELGRYADAEAPLRAAKQIDPAHHMQPQLFLAQIYHRRGERTRAIAELEELLALRPDQPKVKAALKGLQKAD